MGKGLIRMHIEGTYTLLAPPERVWHAMQDQQMLLHAVPGMRQIEALDEHTFALSLTMDQEPFVGNCQCKLTISEKQFPYHYRVALQGTNDQGPFRGEMSIHLQNRDESTIVAYVGTIHLDSGGKPISMTLARGATKLLIQHFFTALDDQLQASDALDADLAAVIERYDVYSAAGTVGMKSKNGVMLKNESSTVNPLQSSSATTLSEERDIFSTVAHFLGLGRGEPEQERVWARRLRRTSTIATLVFLIWLGTRLPHRRAMLECPSPLRIDN
jgi:carbon monoxide dehydrogenase subunit G